MSSPRLVPYVHNKVRLESSRCSNHIRHRVPHSPLLRIRYLVSPSESLGIDRDAVPSNLKAERLKSTPPYLGTETVPAPPPLSYPKVPLLWTSMLPISLFPIAFVISWTTVPPKLDGQQLLTGGQIHIPALRRTWRPAVLRLALRQQWSEEPAEVANRGPASAA